MRKVGTLPCPMNPTKHSKAFVVLQFFFQFLASMELMLHGTVTLQKFGNHSLHHYIYYAYHCGFPLVKFRKMMQHQQSPRVLIPPSSWPDRAICNLKYGPEPTCNLSRLRHGRTSIACTHSTSYNITPVSQMIHRNQHRSMHAQPCNHSYICMYGHLNAPHMHINGSYRHLNALVSASPVRHTH
jgi:hypothetical protein